MQKWEKIETISERTGKVNSRSWNYLEFKIIWKSTPPGQRSVQKPFELYKNNEYMGSYRKLGDAKMDTN